MPPPPSLESVFLVAIASNVLFIISQVLADVMASGPALLLVVKFPGPFVVVEVPLLIIVLAPLNRCSPRPGVTVMVLTHACSVVVPRNQLCYLAFDPSCDVEFLKMASSLTCMAHELSAWSLLIVSILVSRLLTGCSKRHTVASLLACLC